MVSVVFAREYCLHDLADHQEGRIAGVIVDIFETHIDTASVVIVQYDQIVAASSESWFKEVKVDR